MWVYSKSIKQISSFSRICLTWLSFCEFLQNRNHFWNTKPFYVSLLCWTETATSIELLRGGLDFPRIFPRQLFNAKMRTEISINLWRHKLCRMEMISLSTRADSGCRWLMIFGNHLQRFRSMRNQNKARRQFFDWVVLTPSTNTKIQFHFLPWLTLTENRTPRQPNIMPSRDWIFLIY